MQQKAGEEGKEGDDDDDDDIPDLVPGETFETKAAEVE
jgi:nascent polypeptide-associated complex subunit beta